MSRQDASRSWLALNRVSGIGPVRFASLLEKFGHPQAVLDASDDELTQQECSPALIRNIRQVDVARVEQDLQWLSAAGRHLLTLHDPAYPQRLKEIHDPPPVLFVQGDAEVLQTPQLAIVGSRNPSSSGERTAYEFARELARYGITITSGLASGIDGASHRGVLAEQGMTVAVMGTGPDRIYPAGHRQLAEEILREGALVTEFPPGTRAEARNFPRRNRIISGLSYGTLVVEAAIHSGSLISARHAMEQGREVFAIPGSIHNPMARGCHRLIRQGAKLVDSVSDILEELRLLLPQSLDHLEAPVESEEQGSDWFDDEYRTLLNAMGYDPVSVDQLVELSGLTANAVSSMLLVLELKNIVSSQPGGRYIRQ